MPLLQSLEARVAQRSMSSSLSEVNTMSAITFGSTQIVYGRFKGFASGDALATMRQQLAQRLHYSCGLGARAPPICQKFGRTTIAALKFAMLQPFA
jgi:hypothetical protein